MRKKGVGQSEFKIGRWVFLLFIFFLLITTSNEQKSRIDETSQYDADSLIHASNETDRLTYTPWVSHGDGKALSGFGPDPDSSYGNHGPFIVSPDANNRDAASVDDSITIDGNHPSGYDRIGYNGSVLKGGMAFSLNVPKRARIEEAYLWLHAAGAYGSASQVQICVYNVSSVSAFTETTLSDGLLGYAPLLPTNIFWTPPVEANWDGWIKVDPSSLTQLVQSIVNRTDWQAGNYIGFVIDGGTSGNWWRAWHQYGNLPGYAPKLTIRYTYPDWWDVNYKKRVPINVTNNADITLPEGYSVSFSLNTWYLTNNSELQMDGDDLRILYFNSSSSEWKQLDRINTTAFNAYKTQIWFKTQMSIPANSYDLNYYLYYDNPSAYNPPDTSWGQDLDGAFLFFEDFDDGNMFSRWTAQGSWSDEIYPGGSNNHVTKGDQSAYLYKTTGSYGAVAISARIRWDGGDRRRGVSVRYDASLSYSYRLRMESSENGIELRRQASQSIDLNTTSAFPSGVNYDAGQWYRYEIAAQTVNTDDVFVRGRIYDANMTMRMELTYLDTSSYSLYADNKIALYGAGWFDDVILRKFVNPEPTVSFNSPLDTHLILLTKDSTDPVGTYDGGEGGSVNNVPFYNHIVQDFGYVIDYHGHENLASAGDPFFLEGYDGVLISPAVDNAWTVSLREAVIPIITWEERNGGELYLGEASGGGSSLEETLRPNGAGTYDQLAQYPSGSDWQCVDEESPDDGDATYVYKSYLGYTWYKDTFQIENPSASSGSINHVKVYMRCRESVSPAEARTVIRTYSTNYVGTTYNLGSSYTTYSTTYYTNPNTGAAWTWQEVMDLEIGVDVRRDGQYGSATARCTQVFAVVNYTPPPPPSDLMSSAIYVVDQTHYITSEQPLGSVSIYSASATMGYMLNYTQLPSGSDIVLLARHVTNTSQGLLMAIEKGEADYFPPHTAPERRVFWPGQNGSALNTAGWALFDRMLNWTLYMDQQPPVIQTYNHTVYSNQTVVFYTNVTDALETVTSVYLNYTVDGTSQTPVSLQWNGSYWIWETTFSFGEEIRYTILNATDSKGNVNSSLVYVWDFQHSFVIEDVIAPSIQYGGYTPLSSEDGLLKFWFDATDVGIGLDLSSGSVNITTQANPSGIVYPMTYNVLTDYFTVEVGLPYWWIEPTTRTVFSYNFTISDLADLSTKGSGAFNQYVPDIVSPSLNPVNYGVEYYEAPNATIWCNVTDGINGSHIETSSAAVNVSIFIETPPTMTLGTPMQWNGSHWVHNVTFPTDKNWFFYYFNATDRVGNLGDNYYDPGYYDRNDSDEPIIYDYGHEYYGNGTVRFWANVTDMPGPNPDRVERVDLNYTKNFVPQTPVSMQYNSSLWVWSQYFSWNQTLNYTIALAKDGSGNINDTFANVWDMQHSLVTEDWDPPEIEDSGFDALPDYDGHIRFWADISDYSGVDANTVFLNLTLPSGGTDYDYQMSYNGTFYIVELDFQYWWSGSTRTTFDYTFTASDNDVPKNKRIAIWTLGENVPDIVAPSVSSHGVEAYPAGQATIWITAMDGVNGSGVGQVYLNYSTGGPWTYQIMQFNTSTSHWEYDISPLSHGNQISYWVNVTDQAAPTNNSFISPISTPWYDYYFDEFPPTIDNYGYSQNGAGTVTFWATVTDDQSTVTSVRSQFWLNSEGSPSASISMTDNGTHWIRNSYFAWNTTGNYTIPLALDNRGNSNTSLDGVWAKNFVTEDWIDPTIISFGNNSLTDRDGHLEFWVETSDAYSGIDPNNVYLNLTLSGSDPQLYPMTYYTGNNYTIALDLPYWQEEGISRTQYNYSFIVYDNAGNSYSGEGQSDRYVPDVIAPTVSHGGGHGGIYNTITDNITIWSTAYDGDNGSGLNVFPAGVFLNYSLEADYDPNYLVQMEWNASVSQWHYMLNGTFNPDETVFFYINATDYEGNNDTGGLWLFTTEDKNEPKIREINATDYGNGTVKFYANVTDESDIQYVELNYTFSGVPYLQNMTYNGTHYVYTPSYIPWDTTVNYTISRAADIADNVNSALATDFLTLNTIDLEPPVISTTGFGPLSDEDGHLRFWADIEDSYSGLDLSSISINITLSSGASGTYLMTNNGTFYTYETNIAYWEIPYTTRMAVTYNVTAFDNAGRSASNSSGGPTTYIPDVVPPELDDFAAIEEVSDEAKFWCTPQDGISGSQVRNATGASVFLYYTVSPPSYNGPYPMEDNATQYWTWQGGSFSPGEIIYFYVNATDGGGNSIDNAGAPWSHLFGDAVHPSIVTYGFSNLADEDGHLHFWANATDNGAIKNVTLDLFIIDTSTAVSFGMPWNGSYYTASPYLTCGHTFNYNITAYDTALLTDTVEIMGQTVQDTVAPKILDRGVHDDLNGTVTIWVKTQDGVKGTGLNIVSLRYWRNSMPIPPVLMPSNGTENFYTYPITNLQSGDIIAYQITVEDFAANSRTSSLSTYGVADQTPPMIYTSGHEFVPDADGHIRFWVDAKEDIGSIKDVIVEGTIAGSPFSNTMSFNQTYYVYDMQANSGTTVSYTIKASNMAGLESQTPQRNPTVQDIVPPPSQNFVIVSEQDNQDGTVDFRVKVTDGQYGSGINSDTVNFIYRVGGGVEKTGKMKLASGSNYDYKISGLFVGDVINYRVRAQDNAGNTGKGTWRTFGVSDHTAPEIDKIGYDYLPDSDGHIRFWCYAEDPFGTIGKVNINITGNQQEEGVMLWIGAYYYYDTELAYGNTFNFEISVRDTAGNEDSQFESGHTVQDIIPPRVMDTGGEEFQNGTAILWAMVEDSEFGSGFPSAHNTVNITYQLNLGFPKTVQMVWNPSETRYEHVVKDLSVGDIFDFFIQATDNAGNANTGTIIAYKFAVPDTTPPQIHTCGYSLLPEDDGLVQFWVNASDLFGTIDQVLLNITINETATTGKSASASFGMDSVIEVEMEQLNSTYWIHEENLGYQTQFSYTIIVIDGADQKSSPGGESVQIVGDGAPPRIPSADIIDPGNGKLTIWAEVEEEGTGIASLEVVYSVDGEIWERVPMIEYNSTHYYANVEIEAGNPIYWTIATKDLGGNIADDAYDKWMIDPFPTQKEFPLILLIGIIAAAAVTTGISIKKFRKVVGLDKERVMRIANKLSDEDVISRIDDHTFGVVLSYFDQREGPIPAIVTPSLLEDHVQFLINLSDRSFSAGGFVEESIGEKVTIFEIGLEEIRMVCTSYAFALDNPEARGGKENMTINILIDPIYGELTNIFSPEILPSVRWVRSLVENKTPRESVANQMEGLRFLVTRIIAAYQEIYGKEAFIDESGDVIVEEI